jgi:hypothetical protein
LTKTFDCFYFFGCDTFVCRNTRFEKHLFRSLILLIDVAEICNKAINRIKSFFDILAFHKFNPYYQRFSLIVFFVNLRSNNNDYKLQ